MANRAPKILIVDDDADILTNLCDILTDHGYQITTASSGAKALDKIQTKCPGAKYCFDLCLLDFKMPDMDGVELLTRIKSMDPDVRAILITAYAGNDGIERATEAGTITIIRKPVEVGQLLDEIETAIE